MVLLSTLVEGIPNFADRGMAGDWGLGPQNSYSDHLGEMYTNVPFANPCYGKLYPEP